ncbi:MAG: alanine--tRNA ligase [Candidatus Hydrogenedentota bacterium]
MDHETLRKNFLRYFESYNHKIVKSSSLIPQGDPTLLFTNAGMNQFKFTFLGLEKRDYRRAVSSQKCVRAGGKHNDLENVGYTARHHTFFEMLGNFSFGDYFKQDAIAYALEFLNKILGIDKEDLWISIYTYDDEAFECWEKAGFRKERILRLGDIAKGDENNFWAMGNTGPCGPCSEIHFDQGERVGCGKKSCSPACSCDRFLELWNLVFMQFNRQEDGTLKPLPAPSIDTGMGLERLAAIMQHKKSNFETDLLFPIIQKMEEFSKTKYGEEPDTDVSLRVIADHIRAMGFLIADGVLPSNEGRGNVLRRIIRRAIRHSKRLGFDKPVLYRLIPQLCFIFSDVYPELEEKKEHIIKVVNIEEDKFLSTLTEGLNILDKEISETLRQAREVINGEVVFKLYDTYGFPPDLTSVIAREKGLSIDEIGFENEMNKSREKSKGTFKGTLDIGRFEWEDNLQQTLFTGYESCEEKADILFLLNKEREPVDILDKEGFIILDRTPFYAEAGGQVTDTGIIENENFIFKVEKVEKRESNIYLHYGKILKGEIEKKGKVKAKVDILRRKRIMAHHSCTHLLQSAIRKVVGAHIKQSGSYVGPDRLRFDFTHYKSIDEPELTRIIEIVNEWIIDNLEVSYKEMDKEEAIKKQALAFFEEKYGSRVRVVSIADISRELCGGTHCRSTGEIGSFWILKENSIASGVRRIEAVCGHAFIDYVKELDNNIDEIARTLNVNREHLVDRIQKTNKRVKELEKELQTLKDEIVLIRTRRDKDELEIYKVNETINLVFNRLDKVEQRELRNITEAVLKSQEKDSIVAIFSKFDDRCNVCIFVNKNLIDRIDAREIIDGIKEIIDGSGGGRTDFVQAGGRKPQNIDKAIAKIKEFVYRKING